MNYKQRAFLRIMGVLLLCSAIYITCVNYKQGTNILYTDKLCNLQIYGEEIGEIGQQILDLYGTCSKIHFYAILINYNWLIYLVGITSFVIGLWAGLGVKKEKKKNKTP